MVKRKNIDFINDPFAKMGVKLRELRKLHKLTINQLAEALDLSDKIISNYENGHNRMTIETIIKIYRSEVFGYMDLEELLNIFVMDIFGK